MEKAAMSSVAGVAAKTQLSAPEQAAVRKQFKILESVGGLGNIR
jgi:hypothetical protein